MCNKQLRLGHCEIWSLFTCTLCFHSPAARDNTVPSRQISRNSASEAKLTNKRGEKKIKISIV